jgi:hypothetical protein
MNYSIFKNWTLVLFALCFVSALPARAQFQSGVQVIGNTNAALTVGLVPQTNNTVYFSFPPKGLQVTGISSTNEIIYGSYGYTDISGTNYFPIGFFTNSFAGGTNGGTWTTNFPAMSIQAPLPMKMQINVGNGVTNTVLTQ